MDKQRRKHKMPNMPNKCKKMLYTSVYSQVCMCLCKENKMERPWPQAIKQR